MGAVLNGLSLSKIRPYGSGFLIFSDYGRAPIRLAAIMEIPVIYVFTHDSIGVGEDGPTHQPVEQLLSLRAIPGLVTIRPCDANEVAEAWRVILQTSPRAGGARPHAAGAADARPHEVRAGVGAGEGRLRARRRAGRRSPRCCCIGTGSEVALCVAAHEQLTQGRHPEPRRQHAVLGAVRRSAGRSIATRCCRRRSPRAWRWSRRSTLGWERYVGASGRVIGMKTFGASAPLKELQKKFGFEPARVVAAAKQQLGRR